MFFRGVLNDRPSLPDADPVVESDSFDIPEGQTLMNHPQWEDSPDISPTDSASSKASKKIKCNILEILHHSLPNFYLSPLKGTNHSDSRKLKKKKRMTLNLNSGVGAAVAAVVGGGGGIGGVGCLASGSSTSGGSSQSSISLPSKKKRPKLSAASISSTYHDLN